MLPKSWGEGEEPILSEAPLTSAVLLDVSLAGTEARTAVAGSRSANRISSGDNAIDQSCDGGVHVDVLRCALCIFMGGRRIVQNAHYLAFREDLGIVEREKQSLANR